jgi:hypothetical protein
MNAVGVIVVSCKSNHLPKDVLLINGESGARCKNAFLPGSLPLGSLNDP